MSLKQLCSFSVALQLTTVFCGALPAVATAQTTDPVGVYWQISPQVYVDDCFGNCGRGCTGDINPCGGPPRYWTIDFASDVYVTRTEEWESCELIYPGGPPDGYRIQNRYEEVLALASWTFHGEEKTGCVQHDTACRWGDWFSCAFNPFGCGNATGKTEWTTPQVWMAGWRHRQLSFEWVPFC